MAQPFSFMLHVPESGEDASLCDERAVQDSFHQLLQEQCVAEQQLELQELTLGGRENLACSAAAVGQAEACEEPKPRGQHPDFSAATLQILASMPSRTIGRSRGAVISQCYNRTVRLRRQSSQSPLHLLPRSARPSLRQYDLELDSGLAEQDETRSLLVKELQGLTSSQRNHMLQAMPVSLAEKRSIRQELGGQRSTLRKPTRSRRPLSCCGQRRHNCSTGYFTQTLMYYGYYSNFTLNDPCGPSAGSKKCQSAKGHLPYNMPLAYVFTIGVSFFVTCILLVYSMSRSFGESYRVDCMSGHFASKVFCAWDYKVIHRRPVRLQHENIRTQLKELLAEWQTKSCPMSLCRRLGRMLVFSLAWALSLGTVLGCAMAVYFFSKHMRTVHQDSRDRGSSEAQQEAILLALPVVVSLLNLVMPYLYNLLAAWEKQESPVLEVYVAICRNLILKMIILGLLCYHWLSWEIQYELETQCWETAVGQELYRLVVMDFLFTLLDSFLGELLWRLILEKKLGSKRRPEFDIARNVLELIYGQTLTWLGVLFCPLLPAVQILKLVLLFYIKKTSLLKNCQSPSKPWRASHMSTVFITLLCFPSFLGAAIFLSYTIWAVRPSKKCGPFQMQETIYESGMAWIRELEKSSPNITWFTWIHQHLVENTFLLFFVSGVLLAVIYLHIQVVKGQQRIIRLLKEQITNEGEDKAFLIERLQGIYGKRERRI
ncbi:transmembrane channel-like protein 6 isoform X3 [Carettochelys insculpta]|uniref:transmembrane channel-like protein 6 isoform X3 n=1 Tax=Carettochelys insculpta TaxID=44489 RepID=UPI003EBAB5ED